MYRLRLFLKLFLIAFAGFLCLMSYRADVCLFLGSFPAIKNNLYCLKPRKIHIFIDYATTPTLLQMIEFIKLPEKDIKIISWSRYQHRLPLTDGIQSNVTEWTLSVPYEKNTEFIKNEMKKIMNRFVNPEFYLYLNYKHVGWDAYAILKTLPLNKIKALHLYEDGMGTFIRNYGEVSSEKVIKSIQNFIKANQTEKQISVYYSPWLNILPYLYPTYLHVAGRKIPPPPRNSNAGAG